MISLYLVKLGSHIVGTEDDLLAAMKTLMLAGERFEVDYDNATMEEMQALRETEVAARVAWAIQDNRRILVNGQFFRHSEDVSEQEIFLSELFTYFRETCSDGCIVADTSWGLEIEPFPLVSERFSP
jgi:hypothetical protein